MKTSLRELIYRSYGGRTRVRVNALLLEAGRLLLVEHRSFQEPATTYWIPPGGGVQFGESIPEALQREVREETGLEVSLGPLVYVSDFLRGELHAVELYFLAHITGGDLRTGQDPELGTEQMICQVAWMSLEDLHRHRVYPVFLARELPRDVSEGFRAGARYIGPIR
jgi:8-oxo-dGTP diphosphatase|nr:MAG: hypothetical protein KatS3mg041_1481 [Bacteroidota bacterium]